MALFKAKGPIQLSPDTEGSQRPKLTPRSSSNWSIPCCVNLSLYKRPAIQLPDNSDNEQDDDDQTVQSDTEDTPNIFAQHSTQNLSRNPFARAMDPPSAEPRTEIPPVIESFEQEEISNTSSGEEELADFSSRTSFVKYAAESYSDTEEESIKGFELPKKDDEESNLSKEETKEDDKVPQIEDDVLKMLPLPQLSKEIPPAMIHDDASFEESKYSQLPLMSTSLKTQKRISRFSMSEEEYLAYKKSQEEEKIKAMQSASDIPKRAEPIIQETILEQQSQEIVGSSSHTSSEHVYTPQDPLSLTTTTTTTTKSEATHERRSSIAQSILGDKLDDFTEKLAFIKKNIIMSMDSEDEEEVENAEQMLKKIEQQKLNHIPHNDPPKALHRRASSLMDVAPSLARFMNHIGGEPIPTPSASTTFTPSSLFSAFAGQEQQQEDDEELFDFTKVLEIGKNVKTFSEGVVGNGLRMFNDVATRVKNSVEDQQTSSYKQKSASTSSTGSSNNENEWMHNYL